MNFIKFIKALLIVGVTITPMQELYSQVDYYPPRPDGISEADYRNGKLMLENAYAQIRQDSNRVIAHDYWNIAIAYSKMGQPANLVYDYLLKSKMQNTENFCAIVSAQHNHVNGIENVGFYKLIGAPYKYLVEGCETIGSKITDISPEEYAEKFGYKADLVTKLSKIILLDQKYRLPSYDTALQNPIDNQNIKDIEVLIKENGYPGRSLVGKKYESVTWIVIQHAHLSYQEKYLPLIHKTVLAGELDRTPLKMLIDRIYLKKFGRQIFGSQLGIEFADEHVMHEVKKKYDLE